MRVLVTGGSGFIGSAVVRHLLQTTDSQVVNVDKLTYAATPEALAAVDADRRYSFEHADIGDRAAMTRIIRQHRPDAIMNLAAETHVDRSIDAPSAFIQTNIVGTASLLDAALDYWQSLNGPARQAFRFHHVSTDEVFGSLGADGAFSESTPYQPNSPYSASKAAADHLVRAWHHTYGLPTLVSNCSNNYGPWQFPEKLIPLMIINAFHGRPLPVYGKGENVRDWLHVEDHAAALWRILTRGRPGESYNVGGNAERRNLAIVESICDLVDKLAGALPSGRRRNLITFVADRPGHDLRYAIDPTKIRAELGWEPSVDFEQGLERTVAWYLANRNWWEGVRQRVYGQERLGRRGVGD